MTAPAPPRHVLITGASTGIGRCCALRLAARGFCVWAGVRRDSDGAALESEHQSKRTGHEAGQDSARGSLRAVRLDVTDTSSIAAARTLIADATGSSADHGPGLFALINNAGIGVAGPVEFVLLDDWRRQFEVNVIGQIAMTQAFLPLLRRHVAALGGPVAAPSGARILMISSIAGLVSQPVLAPYCASKFALEAISDSLRIELASQGIRTSLIEPGAVQSEIWRKGKEEVERIDPNHPGLAIYGEMVAAVSKLALKAGEHAIPTIRAAQVIERCLNARRPRARYLVGPDAKAGAFFKQIIPTRLWDYGLARSFGVNTKPGA